MANEIRFLRPWADPAVHGTAPLVFALDRFAAEPSACVLAGQVRAGGMACRWVRPARLAGQVRSGGMACRRLFPAALAGQVRIGGIRAGRVYPARLQGQVRLGGGGVWGWSLDVPNGIGATARLGWRLAEPIVIPARTAWSAAAPTSAENRLAFDDGESLTAALRPQWTGAPPAAQQTAALAVGQDPANSVSTIALRFQAGTDRAGQGAGLAFAAVPTVTAGHGLSWLSPPTRIAGGRLAVAAGQPLAGLLRIGLSAVRPLRISARLAFRDGRPLPPGRTIVPAVAIPEPPYPSVPAPPWGPGALVFFRWLGRPGQLIFGRRWTGADAIPRRRVYYVLHDISVHRLPDLIPIPAGPMALSADADAFDIRFEATLYGREALDAVRPSAQGEPVILRVEIDGYIWHMAVETWSHGRRPRSRSISVRGRSLSYALGASAALPTTRTSAAALNLAQLAAAELPLSGWTLDWQAADWPIPAGAWSYANTTPIRAIAEAAAAAGAMILPGRAAQALSVKPRYAHLPWDATATPDVIVPGTAITELTFRYVPPLGANAVYVHGRQGGILARCYLSGTAADALLPAVEHPLITHADGARALAGRLLAAQWPQPELSGFVLPLGGPFPLIQVGQLLEVDTNEYTGRGTVSAVEVRVEKAGRGYRVRQAVRLGEDSGNEASRFARLLPGDPTLAGRIVATGTGTVDLELPGGNVLRVVGTGTVGQTVFAKGGIMIGDAPDLPSVDIEIF